MRLTRAHFATLRDFPGDAEVISHKLMAKAGLIVKTGAGIYTYGPLFWRTLKKIMRIVTEEMDRAGAQEFMMPILQPVELWERSGRLEGYMKAEILWRSKDRKGTWYALGPTHEEVITDFIGRTVSSYKQLPLTLYQQQDKFRDEIRPRFGLMRGREFIMKDAYSFDRDDAGLDVSYAKMREAYMRIFTRCGLHFIVVQADSGAIGGSGSEEFMVTADSGEDELLTDGKGYAANVEKATSRLDAPEKQAPREMRKEPTPGVKTVEQLCDFFPDVPAERMVKTILFNVARAGETEVETVAVLMRGDQDVNHVKLGNKLDAIAVDLADDETVKKVTGAPVGFAGPLGFVDGDKKAYRIRVIADESTRDLTNFLCGINENDTHCLDVNWERDLPLPEFADVRTAKAGQLSPASDAPLTTTRGIEVGHVFKLGTKYSKAMNCTFLDDDGKPKPFVMGCYGIGSSRVAASAVEQNHDDKGIVWPVQIAPYHVHLVAVNVKKADVREVSEKVYAGLLEAGIEVLYDDRDSVNAGVKFADADLLGLPYRINVGRTASEGKVEVIHRKTGESETLTVSEVVRWLRPKVLLADRPQISFPDPDAPDVVAPPVADAPISVAHTAPVATEARSAAPASAAPHSSRDRMRVIAEPVGIGAAGDDSFQDLVLDKLDAIGSTLVQMQQDRALAELFDSALNMAEDALADFMTGRPDLDEQYDDIWLEMQDWVDERLNTRLNDPDLLLTPEEDLLSFEDFFKHYRRVNVKEKTAAKKNAKTKPGGTSKRPKTK